ncbi:Gfo/Idh/MocA family protein [Tardiphaga alba]|uniref:Gfo/Idh/MocA family protein n=1 Tax=Tardiphaga alba TaxID=340268 RepID=UPI0020137316
MAGCCDPSESARSEFSRANPGIPVFETVAAMMKATNPHILSICTPAGTHSEVLHAAITSQDLRAIWCEKPLALNLSDAISMNELCKARNVSLIVNHVRRWSPLWRRVKELVDGGAVGLPRLVRISMPNRLWTIGSHAADLAVMLGGPVTNVAQLRIPSLDQDGEPALPALLQFMSGASGAILVTGLKDRLIVDVEIIGDDGQLLAREDRGEITLEAFESSTRFTGYLERATPHLENLSNMTGSSPFISAVTEVLNHARGDSQILTCGGADALETMRLLDLIAA